MISLATSTHKTMPRKINYPGYQHGGSTNGGDPSDEEKMRYYQELMKQREGLGVSPGLPPELGPRVSPQGSSIRPRGFGRASGGIIGLQNGGPFDPMEHGHPAGIPVSDEEQIIFDMMKGQRNLRTDPDWDELTAREKRDRLLPSREMRDLRRRARYLWDEEQERNRLREKHPFGLYGEFGSPESRKHLQRPEDTDAINAILEGRASGGIIGLQQGGRQRRPRPPSGTHSEWYGKPPGGDPPGPLWEFGKKVVGGIGRGIGSLARGAGNVLRKVGEGVFGGGIHDSLFEDEYRMRDLRRAYDSQRDEEYIEMLNDIGREDATAEFPFREKTVFDGTFEEWLDSREPTAIRASGGIIGLRQGGRSRFPDTVKGRARQARYDKKHGVPASQYGNTAASQNLSYLQQQQQRGSNMAANRVRPANTGVERNSERKKREGQEQGQEQQQQQGPPAYQSAVTSYGVPQQTAQQWANLTDRITSEGQRPYQQYGGQRIAGFTQPEAAAMAGRVAYGQGQGPAGTRQAASTLGQAGQMIGGAQQGLMGLQPQYARAGTGMRQAGAAGKFQGQLAGAGMRTTGTAGQTRQDTLGASAQTAGESGAGTMRGIGSSMAGPEMQKSQDLSPYMSQFTKGVTDPQLQQLMEFQRMQGQELGSQAAQAGAFGGLRQGVQATEQAKAASQQAADIIGQGQQKAFESAQQAFQADRAAQAAGYGQQLTAEQQAAAQEQQGLAAQRAAEQAGVAMSQTGQQQGFQAAHSGAQFGLQGQQAAMGALGAQGSLYNQAAGMGGQLAGVGGQQAALGQQEQQQQFERLRQMEAAGEKQRQLQQQSLGMGYQDWQNQMDQERKNIGWQESAMSGLPYQGTVTQSRYQPQTRGPGASALATGVSALGLYNEYNRNQQGPMPYSSAPPQITPPSGVPPIDTRPTGDLGPAPPTPAAPGFGDNFPQGPGQWDYSGAPPTVEPMDFSGANPHRPPGDFEPTYGATGTGPNTGAPAPTGW